MEVRHPASNLIIDCQNRLQYGNFDRKPWWVHCHPSQTSNPADYHRPRLRFFDRALESGKINLVKRTFVDYRFRCHSARFLIVEREMFATRSTLLRLHSFDKGCGKLSCQIRVFAEILKISSAKRASFYVHPRPQNNRYTFFSALFSNRFPDFPEKFSVKRACRRGSGGKAGRWITQVSSIRRLVCLLDLSSPKFFLTIVRI